MNYKDIIRQMERNCHYGEADEYRRSLERNGINEYERVDRYNPADGAQHTYAGDKAEEAFRDIERHARYEEELREEEREQQRQHEREVRRQQEEEQNWNEQDPEPTP